MNTFRKQHHHLRAIVYCICYTVVVTTIVLLSSIQFHIVLDQNVQRRAFCELQSIAETQVSFMKQDIKHHFAQLHMIESVLEAPGEMTADHLSAMWNLMEETENFTVIGFADMNGNAIDHHGNAIGNIKSNGFFQDIVNGHAEEKYVYLESTPNCVEPELLYAIPAYDEDVMVGVFFTSHKISKISKTEIPRFNFNGQSSFLITNSQGKIQMISNDINSNTLLDNLFEDSGYITLEDISCDNLKQDLQEGRAGQCTITRENKLQYVVYVPTGINDWTLFCMVDSGIAKAQFAKNQLAIRNIIHIITGMFGLVSLLSVLLTIIYVKKQRDEERDRQIQYYGYKRIMNELTCPVFEYDVKNDNLIGNKKFGEAYLRDHICNMFSRSAEWKMRHPEYNFDGLQTEINSAIQYRKVSTFESVLRLPNDIPRWIKTILVPVCDGKENVVSVFGTILETTQEHTLFDNAVEMISLTPSGLHRCYLSDPIHVEYISEGLYRMLGYTEAEVNALLGSNQTYTNLLAEEDRQNFENYVIQLRKSGGAGTCEYRMICKDGSLLPVSDTMEVKYSSDGIIYGYAVVTDIRKYKESQEKDRKKLEDLKIQLNETRLKVSTGQMQPHFLYNALASIREIVLDDPEYASDLIFDFTTHLRACIKSMSSGACIPFSQELENIKAYINIEKMRFGDKLQVKYDISESDFDIIPLGIQPLVENAIRHGIYERGASGGLVEIQSHRIGDYAVISVSDNGVGFDIDAINQEIKQHKRDSTGLQNLIFRFENIMHADIQIESQLGIGTNITVRIPLKGESNHASNRCR